MTIFISKLRAHQIFDSRGNPTLSCTVVLSDGRSATASVPSGASVGAFEALEKRDGNPHDFAGKSVRYAVALINNELQKEFTGAAVDFKAIDQRLCQLDGTDNKARLGANTTLAVSMAVCRAQAVVEGKPLWRFLADHVGVLPSMPTIMANVVNGGAHADNGVPVQEIMVMPSRDTPIENQIAQVFWAQRELREALLQQGKSVLVGDEGGVAPRLTNLGDKPVEVLLDLVVSSLDKVPSALGTKPTIALDVAATEFYDEKKGVYNLARFSAGAEALLSSRELVEWYEKLCKNYPITSIEDGCAEEDWRGWHQLTAALGGESVTPTMSSRLVRDPLQLVGDDLFVSHEQRLQRGVDKKAGNAILIKPNQRGTISEVLRTIVLARRVGFNVVVSHRSGETCDPFIADLAVGVGAEYIKLGALCRGERVAKYNRLLTIAQQRMPQAVAQGLQATE